MDMNSALILMTLISRVVCMLQGLKVACFTNRKRSLDLRLKSFQVSVIRPLDAVHFSSYPPFLALENSTLTFLLEFTTK